MYPMQRYTGNRMAAVIATCAGAAAPMWERINRDPEKPLEYWLMPICEKGKRCATKSLTANGKGSRKLKKSDQICTLGWQEN